MVETHRKSPSEADLRRYCALWQKLLRLQHWEIKIRYAHIRELIQEDGGVAWGRVTVNDNHLRARILILHPNDHEDEEGRHEIEVTVVHELLHVAMSGLRNHKGPDQAGDVVEEQLINKTAHLLVDLYARTK